VNKAALITAIKEYLVFANGFGASILMLSIRRFFAGKMVMSKALKNLRMI
jgi:hypothetical protein